MPRLTAVHPVLPAHTYAQADIAEALVPLLTSTPREAALLRRLHANCGVQTRHLALPLPAYADLGDFTAANRSWTAVAADLGETAVKGALARAGVRPDEVGLLLFTTVTGAGAPSVDAAVAARVGLRPDVLRWPSFGLGCVAGAGGIALAADWLHGHPDGVAVVLAVELCSLTVRRGDAGTANLLASGLFGDGAAAVVLLGDRRAAGVPGYDVVGSAPRLHPDAAAELGFDLGADGFRIVLSPAMPGLVRRRLAPDVAEALHGWGVQAAEIEEWVVHAGGPAILDAYEDGLDLPRGTLDASRATLAAVGNLSSAAVLHTLAAGWDTDRATGTLGLLTAVGPGVSTQSLLLRWSPGSARS